MVLREVVTATWLLIALLNLALGGALFGWISNAHDATCHQSNSELLQRHEQGPLRECD